MVVLRLIVGTVVGWEEAFRKMRNDGQTDAAIPFYERDPDLVGSYRSPNRGEQTNVHHRAMSPVVGGIVRTSIVLR